MINVEEALDRLRFEMRTVAWPGEVLEALPSVTRRSGGLNAVTAFALDAAEADGVIRAEIEYFACLGEPFEWKAFSFDSPSDLVDRLRAAGCTVGKQEAVMLYDLESGLAPFEGSYGCKVSRIENVEQLADFRRIAEALFEKDFSFTTSQLLGVIESGKRGHDGYVVYVDGEPASIGRLYTNPHSLFAGLYTGGTVQKYRGRGCYRAAVAARAHDAAALGARYLLVDAVPTSRPILERLGFTGVADTWPCQFNSSNA